MKTRKKQAGKSQGRALSAGKHLSRALSAVICMMLTCAMVFTMTPQVMAGTGEAGNAEESVELAEGTFAPGQVIVTFRAGAVKDVRSSLKSVRGEENIGEDYGEMLAATSETAEAVKDAKSEMEIISASLGDDFVIEDSIAIADDLIIALVSSEKYETETMIERLSANEDVDSVEANSYVEKQSYEYELDDPLNKYVYHSNSPAADNTAGEDVITRGDDTDPEKVPSTNAGAAWKNYSGSGSSDEVVVAVLDSGVNYDHEDLKDILWKNDPEVTGLAGEYGFNFDDNEEDVKDTNGHGTHVSGILAAAANNGTGVAGTGSGVNVKVMMLATASAKPIDKDGEGGSHEDTLYRELGAFNYVLKAKERGVNVVATSNSWGSPGTSNAYDEIMDRLGEAGIISFVAAGNEGLSLDLHPDCPSGGESEYKLTVGSADISGKASGFSNYGKTSVDFFAPGESIFSTVFEAVYFPGTYTAERRKATSEYYGQFSNAPEKEEAIASEKTGTETRTDIEYDVTPETGADGIKAFGKPVFHAQSADPDDETWKGTDAVCTLNLSTDKYFTAASDDPASLEVTIDNAKKGEEYYLYFPYTKNAKTTGIDNTKFSVVTGYGFEDGDIGALINGGEITVTDEETGNCEISGGGPHEISNDILTTGETIHFRPDIQSPADLLLSAEDAEGKTTGMGVVICPSAVENYEHGDTGRIHFYIDSLGVSYPDEEIEDEYKPDENSSYDLMSGTSMATPSASGAYAVVAALHPMEEGQDPAEYAAETRDLYLSCVRRTDELKDLCRTGGYIDLRMLNEAKKNPVLNDAVCDLEKKTVTIKGRDLDQYDLSYKSALDDDAEAEHFPSGGMTLEYAEDGTSVVISNAEALFGTYTKFILSDSSGTVSDASFFIVKGQKEMEKIFSVPSTDGTSDYSNHVLLTDSEGKAAYAYDKNSGIVSKLSRTGYNNLAGTNLKDAVYEQLLKEGYDKQELSHYSAYYSVDLSGNRGALYSDNVLYQFLKASFTPVSDLTQYEEEEDPTVNKYYLASIRFTEESPAWELTELDGITDEIKSAAFDSRICAVVKDKKIYCFYTPYKEGDDEEDTGWAAEDKSSAWIYDTESGEWTEGDSMPAALNSGQAFVQDGNICVMSGFGFDGKLSRAVYCYDGSSWKKTGEIPFVGKFSGQDDGGSGTITGGIAPVANGFMYIKTSADGAGNIFLYDVKTGNCVPSYYTLGTSLSDYTDNSSAVETKDGIYYLETVSDTGIDKDELYLLSADSGVYETSFPDAVPAPSISRTSAKLSAGKTVTLKVSNGTVKKWTTSKKTVASVKNGKVTALKKGTAYIKAVLTTGETLKCKVTVTSSPKLTKNLSNGGKTKTLTIKVKKGRTKTIAIKGKASSVKNVYTNTKIARVVSKKNATRIKVKGLKKGKTTLKIKVNGVTLKLKVIVR